MSWHWPEDEDAPTRTREEVLTTVVSRGTALRRRRTARHLAGFGLLALAGTGVAVAAWPESEPEPLAVEIESESGAEASPDGTVPTSQDPSTPADATENAATEEPTDNDGTVTTEPTDEATGEDEGDDNGGDDATDASGDDDASADDSPVTNEPESENDDGNEPTGGDDGGDAVGDGGDDPGTDGDDVVPPDCPVTSSDDTEECVVYPEPCVVIGPDGEPVTEDGGGGSGEPGWNGEDTPPEEECPPGGDDGDPGDDTGSDGTGDDEPGDDSGSDGTGDDSGSDDEPGDDSGSDGTGDDSGSDGDDSGSDGTGDDSGSDGDDDPTRVMILPDATVSLVTAGPPGQPTEVLVTVTDRDGEPGVSYCIERDWGDGSAEGFCPALPCPYPSDWDPGPGSSETYTLSHIFTDPGTYEVALYISAVSCDPASAGWATASITISVPS